MSERMLRIGIAGATGAVGREITTLIDGSELPVDLLPMASSACKTHSLELGGRNVRVENLLAEHVNACDLVIMAVPPDVARASIEAALDEGVPLIDLSGVLGPDRGIPLVVAGANRMDLGGFREHLAVASPPPEVVVLASLLAPVRTHAVDLRCRGTVMHSAAAAGRGGIEELSNQVVSLFNSRTPQRTVFPEGLAFDVEPALGAPGRDGWTEREDRAAQQLASVLRVPAERFALSALMGPWFNGICLSLLLETDAGLDADQLERIFEAAPGVALATGADPLPRPRRADGMAQIQLGRLRDDPGGGAVHLWAVADELRFGAAGNAVALLAALIEDDLI
jgi:aspartate-semialdehyde dehydrogenase